MRAETMYMYISPWKPIGLKKHLKNHIFNSLGDASVYCVLLGLDPIDHYVRVSVSQEARYLLDRLLVNLLFL
jgi:hypothetical protein